MVLMGSFIGLAFASFYDSWTTMECICWCWVTILYYFIFSTYFNFCVNKKVPNPHITHTYNKKQIYLKFYWAKSNKNEFNKLFTKRFNDFCIYDYSSYFNKNTLIGKMSELWKVYLPVMILGIIAMGPSAVIAEKKRKNLKRFY